MNGFRTVAIVSALYHAVQGLVWVILAVLGLLSYSCSLYQESSPKSDYKGYLNSYFQGSVCSPSTGTNNVSDLYACVKDLTSPEQLVTWTSIILVVNLFLLITSLALISVLVSGTGRHVAYCLYVFLFFCLFVIVLDVGFTSVVCADSARVRDSDCISGDLASLTLITVAIITSKGIILWLGNICFFLFLLVMTFKSKEFAVKEESTSEETSSSEFTLAHSLDDLNSDVRGVRDEGGHNKGWPCLVMSDNRVAPTDPQELAKARTSSFAPADYNHHIPLNSFSGEQPRAQDPYRRQEQDPYRRQAQDPYRRNQDQPAAQDPYRRQPQDPYRRNQDPPEAQDPYRRQAQDPYRRNQDQPEAQDPYRRQSQDPYRRNQDPPEAQDPYRRKAEPVAPAPPMEPFIIKYGNPNRPTVLPNRNPSLDQPPRPKSLKEAITTMRPLKPVPGSPYARQYTDK